MARIESSVLINKPAADIFAFFNIPENHAKFIPGMREFEQTSPGPFGQVGATARGLRRDFGVRSQVRYEITQVEPGKELGMQGNMGPLAFKDGYLLEPVGDGTRVTFWLEFVLSGVMQLASPFLALLGKLHAYETLANLKKVIETEK